MSNLVFPNLAGLHWEMKVKDEYGVLVQKAAASGYTTRVLLGPDPVLHFECSFNFLRQPGAPDGYAGDVDEFLTLRGFFRLMNGNFQSFLLDAGALTGNPNESAIEGQALTPDANGVAPLVISQASYLENVYETQGAPQLYMGGAPMVAGTDYSIQGPGYASAGVTYPGLVAVITKAITGPITADIGWYYRVRFEQSTQEFDRFLALMYSAQQIQLVTERNRN